MLVDTSVFNSSSRRKTVASRPILVCVSDVLGNYRLDDFCQLNTVGTKMLVGSGDYLEELKHRYIDVHFVGPKNDQSLAHYYANADVLICPNGFQGCCSILTQSVCCGTPIAARSHVMTDDLIIKHITGEINDDLALAVEQCLRLERSTVEQIGRIIFTKTNNLINQRS